MNIEQLERLYAYADNCDTRDFREIIMKIIEHLIAVQRIISPKEPREQ